MVERLDYDEWNELDDVAVSDVEMFRLERMDDHSLWLKLYRKGKTDIVIRLQSDSAIHGTHEEET